MFEERSTYPIVTCEECKGLGDISVNKHCPHCGLLYSNKNKRVCLKCGTINDSELENCSCGYITGSEKNEEIQELNEEEKQENEKQEINFPLELVGTFEILKLYENKIVLERPQGCLSPGSSGSKTILLKDITEIQVGASGGIAGTDIFTGESANGFIKFTIPGNQLLNQNTISFDGKYIKLAEQIKDYIINKNMSDKDKEVEKPKGMIIKQEVSSTKDFSIADELKKLKELLDQGILTQEEFNEQKKKLLNK